MRDDNHYSGAHLLIAFLAGAAAGVAVALMTAPKTGRETRDNLKDWAREAQDKVHDRAEKVPSALKDAFHQASEAGRMAFKKSPKDESPDLVPESSVAEVEKV